MHADRIPQLLPENYRAANHSKNVLNALIGAMDELHAPAERTLDELDRYVDPRRTPVEFLPTLAGWLELGAYIDWSGGRPGAGTPRFAPGMERLRMLIARVADLNASRGTAAALEEFLAVATGYRFSVEENPRGPDDRAAPFHIRIRAPREAARYADLVGRIVEAERPAYATYEIVYSDKDGAVMEGHKDGSV